MNKFIARKYFFCSVCFWIATSAIHLFAQEPITYQKPPKIMANMIESAITRSVKISPNGKFLVILEKAAYPSIKELKVAELRVAGLHINPKQNALVSTETFTSIKIQSLEKKEGEPLTDLPQHIQVSDIQFSPDSTTIAFTNTTDLGVQLWVANLNTKRSQKLSNLYLNALMGKVYQWSPDGKTIFAKFIVENRGNEPEKSVLPLGPYVQQNLGKAKPTKNYPDLLKTDYDQKLLDFYLQSQIKIVSLSGDINNFSKPALYKDFDISPNGNYMLLWTLVKPYSNAVPAENFSYSVSLNDKVGNSIRVLDTVPAADNLPNGVDAVVKGPREFGWRADQPNIYYWVEAQDGGNPSKRTDFRDFVYSQTAEIGPKIRLAFCYYRFNKINWGDDNIAIVTEKWFKTRAERRVFIKPNKLNFRVNLWDRYYENSYDDPGEFITVKNSFNKDVLLLQYVSNIDNEKLNVFSISEGCSIEGNRPYILKFNVKSKLTDTIARSKAPNYEKPIFFNNNGFIIRTKESIAESPNYYIYNLKDSTNQQLTFFQNPHPQLQGIQTDLLKYKRKDSLNLSATLYLPYNYDITSGRLPVLIWAYPQVYKTANAAGQIKTSPYQFPKITSSSPIFWASQGYAVLDNLEMPIIGESNANPNDTYIEQLTQDAEAIVNKLTDIKIAEKYRIAIGGDGYGASMAGNLLAHTKLFAAGIGRSGTYNTTLTPFGFESEERTYWEAPSVYNKLSPFAYASKIKNPLLLIHGEADNNLESPLMQSERFYNALKGNGGISRLVVLPLEDHEYKAKESIWQTLWEMDNWLNKYVKNKPLPVSK
jgi:dipeptidyl aminopeptidase/acylaminoacyl peptidase